MNTTPTYLEFKDIPDQTTFITTGLDDKVGIHINNSDDAMYCRHYFTVHEVREIAGMLERWLADYEG